MKDFFNNVYKVLIEKRTDFSGRASRSEYWSSWLFIQLTSIFLLLFAWNTNLAHKLKGWIRKILMLGNRSSEIFFERSFERGLPSNE